MPSFFAQNALRALLNQGMGALDDLKDKLQEAGGSAAETAAVMDNNRRMPRTGGIGHCLDQLLPVVKHNFYFVRRKQRRN